MSRHSETYNQYYTENHVRRIRYQLIWIDPYFKDYLTNTYGNPEKFLAEAAVMVSVKNTGEVRYSLPTAGRALCGNLQKTFPDPLTGLPIDAYDTKGCLFTKSGHRANQHKIKYPHEYHEIDVSEHDPNYVWGPLSQNEAKIDQKLTQFARNQGIETILPLAILEPLEMVYDGEIISVADYVNLFGLGQSEYGIQKPALYLRGYPITAARSADMIVDDTACAIPMVSRDDPGSSARFSAYLYPKEYLELIHQGRKRWQEIEKPKIMRALRAKNERKFDADYFNWTTECAISQAANMILAGITPSTSVASEKTDQANHHTHIQNKTLARATEVEFAPTISLDMLDQEDRHVHLREFLSDMHEYIVNTAMFTATNLNQIPFFGEVVTRVNEACGGDPDLIAILKEELPVTEEEAAKFTGTDQEWRLIRGVSRGDDALERAIERFGSKF